MHSFQASMRKEAKLIVSLSFLVIGFVILILVGLNLQVLAPLSGLNPGQLIYLTTAAFFLLLFLVFWINDR